MTILTLKSTLAAGLAGLGLTLTACASTAAQDSYGATLQTDGNHSAAFGKAWDDGKALEAKGLKLAENGREDVRDGEKKRREGESLIDKGKGEIAALSVRYDRSVRDLGVATTAKQVRVEAKALDKIADDWADAEDRIAKGEKLVREGGKDIAEGQAHIREAEAMIDKGRAQMATVEAAAARAKATAQADEDAGSTGRLY